MHLSFASSAPGYLSTSEDHGHTRSLEAYKSPASTCRFSSRVGHLGRQVTDKVPAPIPQDIPDEVQTKIPGPNDHH